MGAAVGAAVGGPVGGIIGAAATPPLVDLVGRAWDELRGRRERNVVAVVGGASGHTGLTPDDFIDVALNDANLSRLLHGALRAAAETLDRQKIEALARCLANGVTDDARVDKEGLIIRALSDLDPVHIRVLAKLESSAMTAERLTWFLRGDLSVRDALTELDVSGAVLAVLERHGLVTSAQRQRGGRGGVYDRGPQFETEHLCSEFGRECLERLGYETRSRRRLMEKMRNGRPSRDVDPDLSEDEPATDT